MWKRYLLSRRREQQVLHSKCFIFTPCPTESITVHTCLLDAYGLKCKHWFVALLNDKQYIKTQLLLLLLLLMLYIIYGRCMWLSTVLTWAKGVGGVKVDGKFMWHLRRWETNKVNFLNPQYATVLLWTVAVCRSPSHPLLLYVHHSLSFVLFISAAPWQHRWVDSCVIVPICMYNAYCVICACVCVYNACI